ncbi:MAG TPA: YbaK/EbsC family protein [Candidatus Methylomirabilis sp.]|nr:YbaK/EbsC family protein [Candidatus Methylomirabilis sp.]
MAVASTIKRFLKEHNVAYDVVVHRRTLSSMETAAEAHVPGDRLIKCVVIEDEAGYLMVALPSTRRLELGQLHRQLQRNLGLATERELSELFKDCDVGAIPPIGAAYGIETLVDDSLLEEDDIYFEAGDHEELIHMSGRQFQILLASARHGRYSYHV